MKEPTDKPPITEEIAEAWSDLELGVKIALSWLMLVVIGLVVVGIIFPIAGIIMVALLAAIITFGVIAYLMDEY